jgi:hypothetical protein
MKTVSPHRHYAAKIAAFAALLSLPAGLMAATIDGNVQASEYSTEYDVSFNVQNYANNPVPGGQLFSDVSGNVLDIGLIIPTTICDNVYSTTSPTPGWGTKQHKFSDLVGSDEWSMTVGAGTIVLDYIGSSAPYKASVASAPSGYASRINVATSLQFNLAPLSGSALTAATANSPTANWINNIEYEWSIDLTGLSTTPDQFLAGVLASMTGSGTTDFVHLSPNKLGGNVVNPTPPSNPPPVPDGGSTIVLLGIGMLALAGYGWQSRKLSARLVVS